MRWGVAPAATRRAIIITPAPDCLTAAAMLYRDGDLLALSLPGQLPTTLASLAHAQASATIVILAPCLASGDLAGLDSALAELGRAGKTVFWPAPAACSSKFERLSSNFEHVTIAVAQNLSTAIADLPVALAQPFLDLGHPQLPGYLRAVLNLALLHHPEPTPLIQAMAVLQQAPMRLSRDDMRMAELLGGVSLPLLAGSGRAAESLRHSLRRLAAAEANILITGDPGTGREDAARLIHALSNRSHRPVAEVDCAGMSEPFLRSVLFGHTQGAFPWAHEDRQGLLAELDTGTLLLWNVHEMPSRLQADFARFVRQGGYQPTGAMGGSPGKPIQSLVRVLATASPDCADQMTPHFTRLYYQLNEGQLRMPSLAEAKEDLLSVVQYLLCLQPPGTTPEGPQEVQTALEHFDGQEARLREYAWPGNNLELAGLVRHRLIWGDEAQFEMRERAVPARQARPAIEVPATPEASREPEMQGHGLELRPLAEVITEYVRQADQNRGAMSRKELAGRLGVTTNTLNKYLR
jgi:DNA-binding NtrC family response regulator